MPSAPGVPRGLILDWGGVLTGDLRSLVRRWAEAEQIDVDAYISVMREWFGGEVEMEARINPVHALERGEMAFTDFEARLAAALTERTGVHHDATGLLSRMFALFDHAHDMNALVRRAHEAGIRTALLSNSWGDHYPRDMWEGMFDAVVISGEVGMRKPEPRIFHYTLEQVGLAAEECVFVDDLAENIHAAAALGFIGVHHTSYDETARELEALFGIPLA